MYSSASCCSLKPLAEELIRAECRARGRGAKDLASRSDGDTESDGVLGAFEHTAEHPLECDAVLVDEASMLDLPLAAALLAALPRHRQPQLVLVGEHIAPKLTHVGPATESDTAEGATLLKSRSSCHCRSKGFCWIKSCFHLPYPLLCR